MALKFRDRDNVRDAYRAGVSGARSYPGPEGKGYDSSFQRGRRSAKQFRNRKFRPTKRNVGNFGDKGLAGLISLSLIVLWYKK